MHQIMQPTQEANYATSVTGIDPDCNNTCLMEVLMQTIGETNHAFKR